VRFTVTQPTHHFDLELCVSSGQVFRWARHPGGGWLGIDGDQWYRVSDQVPQGADYRPSSALVHATGMNRDAKRDALAYVAEPRRTYDDVTYHVEANGTEADFRNLFRLDWNADEVRAEILRRGPEVEPYLGSLEGLRLMRPSDPVETFFSFLCTPNNNLPRIVTMVAALAKYGPVLDTVEGVELRRFPEVDEVAAIPEAELRERKFGYRAATIPRAAQELARRGGRDYLESLKRAPYEEAHAELVSFHGIGPKLADCIALFALHHTCSVPVDTHLWHAATRLYFPEWEKAAITDLKYKAVSAHVRSRFGDLTGWAHQHLFFDSVLNWRSRLK
jgi:N-glycosylase/DNA lyase